MSDTSVPPPRGPAWLGALHAPATPPPRLVVHGRRPTRRGPPLRSPGLVLLVLLGALVVAGALIWSL